MKNVVAFWNDFFLFLKDISPFCEATDTQILNFWSCKIENNSKYNGFVVSVCIVALNNNHH